ncbi:MAG: serine hydrolase domain-containing protein [Thermomicrobiales bacterium]
MTTITPDELATIVDAAGYADAGSIAVAVVSRDGCIVRQERGLLTTGTRVYGASLTKQVVAAFIAQEVAADRLDPDAPIATWFPNFPSWVDEVTIRHLLHHIGGLPDEQTLGPRMPDPDHTRRTGDDMIAAVRTFEKLPAAVGSAWSYSNIGYVLLGRILEVSTGQSLKALFAERAAGPLEMIDSLLWDGPDLYPEGANPLDPAAPTPHSLGDGGMWTTADDLTRWIQAMNGDALGVRSLITVPGTLADGTALDYAWGVIAMETEGTMVYRHGGGWYGSISHMAWIPERNAGFIAFTVDGGDPLTSVVDQLIGRLATAG